MSLWERLAVSILLFLAAGGIAWGFESGLRRLLSGLARRTRWVWDELIADSLRGIIVAAGLVGACFWLSRWWRFPPGVAAVVDKTLLVAALLVLFVWSFRFAVRALRHVLHTADGGIPSVSIIINVTRLGVVLVATLVILQVLGIPITPLLTALGIGGLAIALALQDTLSNLFAGLHILAARQIRPGDFIRLDSGHEGAVEDINWRTTTIRRLDNNIVIIPNSQLASATLINYRMPLPEMSVVVRVSVAYGSELEKVEKVALRVARTVQREVPGAVPDFEPLVRFQEFGDSGILFVVILRAARVEEQYLLRHEFIKRLYAAYRAEGIEIPYPMRHVVGALELRTPGGDGGGEPRMG